MSISRKHFEVIAATLKNEKAPKHLCYALACEFSKFNDLFDIQRFMTSCGHGE